MRVRVEGRIQLNANMNIEANIGIPDDYAIKLFSAVINCRQGATALSIMTFSIMIFSIMTFSIMTFSIMTLTIRSFFVTLSMTVSKNNLLCDTKHK